MNVTGGGTKLVFCEGEPQSLDYRLLNGLLRDRPPATLVVPSGGKQGLRAFIRGRLTGYQNPPRYVAFRDRDFDVEPPASIALIRPYPDRSIFLSYRAAVENYLIDAALIDGYWNEHSNSASNWNHGDSPGIDDIASWIDDAARGLIDYQAARWALASLKPSERWPELSTTWTDGSGHLPTSLAEDDCLVSAKRLVSDFKDDTRNISEDILLERYKRFSAEFASPDFMDRADYLVWFHGKDLGKAMQRQRPNSISVRHFLGWAADHIHWNDHPDLKELAAEI